MADRPSHVFSNVFGVGDTRANPAVRVAVMDSAEGAVLREGGEVGGWGGHGAVKGAGVEFRGGV